MDADSRRNCIRRRLESATKPLSAGRLGQDLGVSRQVIVGDIALLRASGTPVLATNRGYLLARPTERPRRSIHVRHSREQVATELEAIIDAGAAVLDASVEHRLYGQITVDLQIRSHTDIAAFCKRMPVSTTLAELTNGWHTHTIEAADEATLDAVEAHLGELGFLWRDQ
ncbi:Probable transcription repressor NiaR [Actinomyces bovis]|uniref:Probable transcription repressor NiaR n=1 Tax=Actinomyces bovis TaxID=1658 RepID=A0ABY1VRL4_9ACTO|nr:transcription repressor NadR [Actinomyces bovis]SPT55020.1 Probable transcription repressor NiaR [Actinomyces bovis]VEG56160.1 Probable transcription repressor NiaR [Actinomyces israelii]